MHTRVGAAHDVWGGSRVHAAFAFFKLSADKGRARCDCRSESRKPEEVEAHVGVAGESLGNEEIVERWSCGVIEKQTNAYLHRLYRHFLPTSLIQPTAGGFLGSQSPCLAILGSYTINLSKDEAKEHLVNPRD